MVRSSNPLLDIYLSLACHHHCKITKLPCLLHPILFFLSFVFVRSRKVVEGGLIEKKHLFPASDFANASGHLHFSHICPSLSWDHLWYIGPLHYYWLREYYNDFFGHCTNIPNIQHFCQCKVNVFPTLISILVIFVYHNTRVMFFCTFKFLVLLITSIDALQSNTTFIQNDIFIPNRLK